MSVMPGKKFIRAIRKTISAILYYYLTLLVPKHKNIWVFGSWKGRNYNDNSKELFEYVSENHKEINAYWIAKNKEVYNLVKKKGYKVLLYPSYKTQLIIAKASINIQTESNEDTGLYRVGGAKIIQLFHGYGAPKELFLYGGMGKLKKAIVKIYADNHGKSYWMVPSEYFINRFPVVCETDPHKMFITGQPRIDLLLKKLKVGYFENFKTNHLSSKLILYAPTHRNYALSSKTNFTQEEWILFNNYLRMRDYYVFFKPHPLELSKYLNLIQNYSNIILVSNDEIANDLYEYMHYFDLLISDYSSISADYLVFDKPIIHFMYDINDYVSDTCNLDALDSFQAGPICKNFNDLFNKIDESLQYDSFKNMRSLAKRNALCYIDTNNCKRVFDTIINCIL